MGNTTTKNSIAETVNNIVTNVVTKTTNSYKVSTNVDQKIEVSCTPDQLKLAVESVRINNELLKNNYANYLEELKLWYQYADKTKEAKPVFVPPVVTNFCSIDNVK